MKALIQTFLLLSMITLIGCGSKESNVSLKVSSGFALTSAGYTGGLLATGIGPGSAKFSASAGTGNVLSTKIVDGTWKIFVVGWDGSAAFTGTKYCGVGEVKLGSSDSEINISVTSANCSVSPFSDEVTIKDVFTTSCAAFYQYQLNTNVFSTPTTDNFCATLPVGLDLAHSHYKLIALNQDGTTSTPTNGIGTLCLSTDSSTPIRREIPVNKFPFRILTYPTLLECQNSINPRVAKYDFPNGVAAGNPGSFDHLYQMYSANSARLVVPSSMTRRGYSPFMSMIPRILCGADNTNYTDCVNSPLSLEHVYAPWYSNQGGHDKQLLLKGISNSASIPSTFLNMTKFGVKDIEIEDGNVFGSVYRNQLTCQTATDFVGIRDIYTVNDHIYVLLNDGSDSIVKVYTLKGDLINEARFTSVLYSEMAVAADETLYLAHSTTVAKYASASGSYSNVPTSSHSGSTIQDIELNSNGTVIAIAEYSAGSNYIIAYSTSSFAATGTNQAFTSPMKQMQFSSSYLYTYSGDGFKKYPFVTSLTTPVTIGTPSPAWEAFAVNGSDAYGFTTTGYKINKVAVSSVTTVATSSSTLIYTSSGTEPKQLLYVGGKIILADQNNSTLQLFDANLGSATQEFDGECTEVGVAAVGAVSESLNFITKPNDSIHRIFSDLFESAGVRFLTDNTALYAFKEFKPHGLEVRTGGKLSHVQQMLGPDGIASFVSDFPDCNTLKSALAVAPGYQISRTRTFYDFVANKTESYTGTFKKINEDITNSFFCKDSTLSGSCVSGTDVYDIEVTFGSNDTSSTEKNIMKLSCGRQVGSSENYELEGTRERREFVLWNTGDYTKGRFEQYSVEVESQHRGQIQKFVKTGANTYWMRRIHLEESTSNTNASVMELQTAGTEITSRAFHISDTTSNFTSVHGAGYNIETYAFDSIRDGDQFNTLTTPAVAAPMACMSFTNNSMTSASTCSASSFAALSYTSMSADTTNLSTSIDSLIGISSNSHPIWGVYEIP